MASRRVTFRVKGLDKTNASLQQLGGPVMDEVCTEVLTEALQPARIGLHSLVVSHPGKHDGQKPSKSGRWNRWEWKTHKPGHPVGFSRAMVERGLRTPGWGLKFWKNRNGFITGQVKAWAPGIFIIDRGRYRGLNTSTGWRVIVPLFKGVLANARESVGPDIRDRVVDAARARGLA